MVELKFLVHANDFKISGFKLQDPMDLTLLTSSNDENVNS